MATTREPNRAVAASGTILFHTLFLLLIIFSLKQCGGGGDGIQYLSLNIAALGEPDQGGPSDTAPANEEAASVQTPVEEQPVETQENAPVEAPKAEKPKPTPKPADKPVEKPKESKAGNLIKDNASKPSDGSGKDPGEKPGVNGNPTGSITGKGIFDGGKGGIGGDWSLSGRGMEVKPSLSEKPKDEGKVVVDIKVDRDGKVVYAKANPAKSDTPNSELYALAEKAAKTARFNADQTKGVNQSGTITIIFTLN